MSRILLLGGTTEASHMARLLADQGMDAIFSYAGRTAAPQSQPLPLRIGGFGGAEGLADYLCQQRITHLIDATHPFAAQISRNAITAAQTADVPLMALERPAWQPGPGDVWQCVPDLAAAARALPDEPAKVFLAIGKQNLDAFAGLPHRWLLRLVDPPATELPLMRAHAVIARGPFTPEDDEALLHDHQITHLVAKNSGGAGAEAKLIAARRLSLPVILIDRPTLPQRNCLADPKAVLDWLHQAAPPARRGV